jgi:hypothetical protein
MTPDETAEAEKCEWKVESQETKLSYLCSFPKNHSDRHSFEWEVYREALK